MNPDTREKLQSEAFQPFTDAEVRVGLDYAEQRDGLRLMWHTLKVVANHAGAIRKSQGVTPRVATVQALRAYERSHHVDIDHSRFEGYVHAAAKMMAERNPKTREKRRREAELADLKAATS